MGVTDPKRGRIAIGGSSKPKDDEKYFIYSSKAGKTPGVDIQVLTAGSSTDNFVSSLEDQVIILKSSPDNTADIDSSDKWYQWLTKLDTSKEFTGAFSLTVDDTTAKNIESFQFTFKAPWDVTFSSSSDALNFSFGPPAEIGPGSAARIPVPGLDQDGTMLYCGLDSSRTQVLKSTVKDLFAYVGLDGMVPFLPSALRGLSVTLDASQASGNHNALWFNPSFASQTTVRLQFQLAKADKLQEVLSFALPSLAFPAADVICKKILVAAETEAGPASVDQGQVLFHIQCSVTPKNSDPVNMTAGVEFRESAIMLNFRLDSPDTLSGILVWLGGLISDDLAGFIQSILNKDGVFPKFSLRRMNIGLDTSQTAEKPSLSSFAIDIEASANFGQGSDLKTAVFLLTYTWTKEGGKLGSIRGQFWNSFDLSPDRDLSPYYEEWTDLQPITPTPATSLNLATIISGQSIENVPGNIPTDLTRAYLFLSDTNFALGGTIDTDPSFTSPPKSVPQPYLGQVSLDASYAWGNSSGFKVSLGIQAGLRPSPASKHDTVAVLTGQLDYDSSTKTWEMQATLEGLYASTLYEFFDPTSADHVMPLIDSIEISNLAVDYKYSGTGKSVGSFFKLSGLLLVAALELQLTFVYQDDWHFTAELQPQDAQATIGEVIASILGDGQLNLPPFLANMQFGGEGQATDTLIIDVRKEFPKSKPKTGTGTNPETGADPAAESFQFIASVAIGPLELTFAQYHSSDWAATVAPKRMVKVALTSLEDVPVPLVGLLAQPFDEMYYMWVQDVTAQNKPNLPGLTRKEIGELNNSPAMTDKLVPKDKFKKQADSDVLIGAGSHFAVIIKNSSGDRTCILDYNFAKPKDAKTKKRITAASSADTDGDGGDDDDDNGGENAQAPFKKTVGPLTISNIALKFSDMKLHIMFDATFELGPLGFSLLGFSIDLEITTLSKPDEWHINASIQGLTAAFENPPLSIAGVIRHGNTGSLDYYAGGLIVGFDPYQFQAAGFYGVADLPNDKEFKSVFIFTRLDGPLVTLEFAEISGLTGGFGYNSDVRIPTLDEVTDFPFIATHILDGNTDSALQALEKLTSPDAGGWFSPLDNTFWAAAGLKVDAFQMLSLDAVILVQFGKSVKLNLFAVAVGDIPDVDSPVKYAHVELGIVVLVDFDYGILKAEAQLSPNSYILHPDCHLTGGFGLYYWFDAPHAEKANIGEFVFTLGGYHQAFSIPDNYPNPPRLGISWNLGGDLSISGEAYFAITPKVCMGGGRLHASFSAGPIEAFFDAFADFLINYKPFQFLAEGGICVGVRFNIDILFIHTHISVEIGADLTLWGPPVAGRVHVNFWITSFDINFGDSPTDTEDITLILFYGLVLQASQKKAPQSLASAGPAETPRITDVTEPKPIQRPKNEAHVFLPQSGLMNDSDGAERQDNAPWVVRGGTFSFIVSCLMAVETVILSNDSGSYDSISYDTNNIYSRPMKLTGKMTSTLSVAIKQDGSSKDDAKWGMDRYLKSVPTALWAIWSSQTDPSGGNNNLNDLLNSQDSGYTLMMGVLLTAPPPKMSKDKIKAFNIEDTDLQELEAKKNFPKPVASDPDWEPVTPLKGLPQWKAVQDKWSQPLWGTGEGGQAGFVKAWATAFGWDETLEKVAAIPTRLNKKFMDLYVAAPLMTK